MRWFSAAVFLIAICVLQSCANEIAGGRDKVALTASQDDSPYSVDVRLFALPEGSRHLNHFTYSLKIGRDGFLYFGVGDNASNANLLRFDPAAERITDLGDFRSALPASIRDQGSYGKFHVGPHQMSDGSVYFASYYPERWKGERTGRLFRYKPSDGIVDLGPTPHNQGVYFMFGDDAHNRLYFAEHDSHFTVYDIAAGKWEDKGRFTSKPPFIGLTDQAGRLYMYGYDGKGEFVPGPSTIARYDPVSDSLEISRNAPPTLWVGAATSDHVTAWTTTYLDGDLFSWRFAEWPNFNATGHGRIDPKGRPVDSNNLSITPDGERLVVAGSIESKDNHHLGQLHGVWVYDIGSRQKYLAARLNDALTESFGTRSGKLKIYWTSANIVDSGGWIYVGIHIVSETNPEARLLALRIRSKELH